MPLPALGVAGLAGPAFLIGVAAGEGVVSGASLSTNSGSAFASRVTGPWNVRAAVGGAELLH